MRESISNWEIDSRSVSDRNDVSVTVSANPQASDYLKIKQTTHPFTKGELGESDTTSESSLTPRNESYPSDPRFVGDLSK